MKIPKNPKVIAIIPARGGSKSIPYKNIALLNGKPLIYYSIREAKLAKKLDWFIISTDDKKIAKIAKQFGADVPFLRPKKYAHDTTSDLSVFKHALLWLKKNRKWNPEIIINLRPSEPFHTAEEIDQVINLMQKSNCDSIKTIIKAPVHPYKMWYLGKDNKLIPVIKTRFRISHGPDYPRQKLRPVYLQDGYIDATRSKFILNGKKSNMFGKNFRGLIRNDPNVIDIDSPEELLRAQEKMKKIEIKLRLRKKDAPYNRVN